MSAVASLDGIPFIGERTAGAAFRLDGASPKTAQFSDGDWVVELGQGATYVIAAGSAPDGYDSTWRKALTMALQGLDVFSARGIADLALTRAADEHIIGWRDTSGQVLRLVGTADFNVTVPVPTITVTNAAGGVVPQPPPISVWHESMRYYRQAQRADDVFESYRSLWLATENLLDAIEPYLPTDSEERWLRRAFKTAHAQVDLLKFLPGSQKAPHNAAYDYYYVDARTHLFHAKASRGPLLPDEPHGTNMLIERHTALTGLFLRLLEAHTGVGRRGGFMFPAWFDRSVRSFDQGAVFLVTDDRADIDPAGTSINPGGGTVVPVTARRDEPRSKRGRTVFIGETDGRSVEVLETIQKAGFACDQGLIAAEVVLGDLSISGFDLFEVQMAFRLQNRSQPRSFNEM